MHLFPSSLRSRLLFASVVPVVLFLLAAAVAALAILHLNRSQESAAQARETLTRAYDVKANLALMKAAKRAHHLVHQQEQRDQYDRKKIALSSDLAQLHQLTQDDSGQQQQVARARQLTAKWLDRAELDFEWFNKKFPVIPEEIRLVQARTFLQTRIDKSQEIENLLDSIIHTETEQLNQRKARVNRAIRTSVWASIVALSVAVVLAIVIPLYLSRSFTNPLRELRKATDQLRCGNFTTLTPSGPQEIATLTSYFNMMGLALSEREELRTTEKRRYQGLVGSMTNLLWSMDPEGNLREDFASWAKYTGQPEQATQGEGWLEAVHPDDRTEVEQQWRQALKEKRVFERECRLRRHDGSYRLFAYRCIPIFDNNKVAEWICACTDVTERKQQEILRQEKEAAEAASQAKSQFLARMSHELRTPLNAIIGMSKMLATQRFGSLNEKQLDYVTDVINAGEHLLNLINDVLDLSRVEAGQLQVQFATIAVSPTVIGALDTVRSLALQKQQALRHSPLDPEGEMKSDLGRFKQILINLLSNAIKFTPEGGEIHVRAQWVDCVDAQANPCPKETAAAIRLDVEDTGIGIPPQEQESIWQEFRQASTREKSTEGTGLGLALTRKLVTLLGGIIWLKSEPGQGSCFSMTFPVLPPPATQPPEPILAVDRPESIHEIQKPLALIIEDNEPTNKLLVDWLVHAGLRTASAFNGSQGLEEARRLRPQIILLDLLLPHVDGWQVLQELNADPITSVIPVMIVSARHGEVGDLHVVDWLVKPVNEDLLLDRLRRHCPELFTTDTVHTTLIVDDDPASLKLARDLFETIGLQVWESSGGEQAMELLQELVPDLIVVDLLMPGMDGFEVVEQIRAQERLDQVPILILSNKEMTAEDWEKLDGKFQEFLPKTRMTVEKLTIRLQRLRLI